MSSYYSDSHKRSRLERPILNSYSDETCNDDSPKFDPGAA